MNACRQPLKIHISLPEDGSNQLAKGCDIINPILRANNVDTFRMIFQGKKTSEIANQQGKVITINCFGNPEKSADDWKIICEKILDALLTAKIQPGTAFLKEGHNPVKAIKGSHEFMSYSYEITQWPEMDLFDRVVLESSDLDNEASKNITSFNKIKI